MELLKARRIAIDLIHEHLPRWHFALNDHKGTLGLCNHSARRIEMSRYFIRASNQADIVDTIQHEKAHALVGPHHDHDEVWRAVALELGCSGSRTGNFDLPDEDWLYLGNCKCGHKFRAHRLGKIMKIGIHNPGCQSKILWRNTRTGALSFNGESVLDASLVTW